MSVQTPECVGALSTLVASDKVSATGSFISLPCSRVCSQISSLVHRVCLQRHASASGGNGVGGEGRGGGLRPLRSINEALLMKGTLVGGWCGERNGGTLACLLYTGDLPLRNEHSIAFMRVATRLVFQRAWLTGSAGICMGKKFPLPSPGSA